MCAGIPRNGSPAVEGILRRTNRSRPTHINRIPSRGPIRSCGHARSRSTAPRSSAAHSDCSGWPRQENSIANRDQQPTRAGLCNGALQCAIGVAVSGRGGPETASPKFRTAVWECESLLSPVSQRSLLRDDRPQFAPEQPTPLPGMPPLRKDASPSSLGINKLAH